jgi:hypothetical protein
MVSISGWLEPYSSDHHVASDRVNGQAFYLLETHKNFAFWYSLDGGASWEQSETKLPGRGGYNAYGTPITVVSAPNKAGEVWVSLNGNGVWRSSNYGKTFTKIPFFRGEGIDSGIIRVGFGKEAPNNPKDIPTVYVYGRASGEKEDAMYRSIDLGNTWDKLLGYTRPFSGALAGDRRAFGKIYSWTYNRGLIVGSPEQIGAVTPSPTLTHTPTKTAFTPPNTPLASLTPTKAIPPITPTPAVTATTTATLTPKPTVSLSPTPILVVPTKVTTPISSNNECEVDFEVVRILRARVTRNIRYIARVYLPKFPTDSRKNSFTLAFKFPEKEKIVRVGRGAVLSSHDSEATLVNYFKPNKLIGDYGNFTKESQDNFSSLLIERDLNLKKISLNLEVLFGKLANAKSDALKVCSVDYTASRAIKRAIKRINRGELG